MKDQIIKKIALTPDEDGNITVRCPECDHQFKTAASNISNDPDSPSITCPACGRELTHVLPAGKEVEEAIQQIESEVVEGSEKKLADILRKYL